jgi:hypothetical protein
MFPRKPRGPRMGPGPQGMFAGPQFPQGPMPGQNLFEQGQYAQDFAPQQANLSSMYPQTQLERLLFEITENRRRINNLTRRVTRLENYLRIRDTSDYSLGEDNQIPNEFSM